MLVGRQIRLNPWTFTLEPFKKALPTLGSFSPSCNSSCFACTWNKNYKDNNSVSTTFATKQTSLAKFDLEHNLFFLLVTCKKKYLCSATVALHKGRSSVLQQTRKANFAPNPKATHALPIRIQPRVIISPNDPTSKANEPQKQ